MLNKKIVLFLFAISALKVCAQAPQAQEDTAPVPAAQPPKQTKLVFKKEESHKFGGSKLKGKLKKPEISYIYQRKGLRSERIVNIPENFDDKITESAEHF